MYHMDCCSEQVEYVYVGRHDLNNTNILATRNLRVASHSRSMLPTSSIMMLHSGTVSRSLVLAPGGCSLNSPPQQRQGQRVATRKHTTSREGNDATKRERSHPDVRV